MKHDFTEASLSPTGHAAKDATRRTPLDILREHSSFLWSKDSLRCDWMELCAEQAPTLQILLNEGALRPGGKAKFIGVDLNPQVIEGCRAHYGDEAPAEWHADRLESLVSGKDAFRDVGVLVFDTEYGLNRGRWGALDRVVEFARRQAEALGEFVLVVNVVADKRFSREEHVLKYLAHLSQAVGREISNEALHSYKSGRVNMAWTMVTFGF